MTLGAGAPGCLPLPGAGTQNAGERLQLLPLTGAHVGLVTPTLCTHRGSRNPARAALVSRGNRSLKERTQT